MKEYEHPVASDERCLRKDISCVHVPLRNRPCTIDCHDCKHRVRQWARSNILNLQLTLHVGSDSRIAASIYTFRVTARVPHVYGKRSQMLRLILKSATISQRISSKFLPTQYVISNIVEGRRCELGKTEISKSIICLRPARPTLVSSNRGGD